MSSEISLMILNSGESQGSVFIVDINKISIDELKNNIHKVFIVDDVNSFLKLIKDLIKELKNLSENIDNFKNVISEEDIGIGKVININLEKIAVGTVVILYAQRFWKNPQKSDEIYVSFETGIYGKDGLIKDFQRVLIRKGSTIYNVSLKI